jgi:uncharacterized protein (TIGR03437 family)
MQRSDVRRFVEPVLPSNNPVAPGVFTIDGTGYGQIAAINEDGTVNSPAQPAARGSVVAMWLTGFGRMQPVPLDGEVPSVPSAKPVLRPVVHGK